MKTRRKHLQRPGEPRGTALCGRTAAAATMGTAWTADRRKLGEPETCAACRRLAAAARRTAR